MTIRSVKQWWWLAAVGSTFLLGACSKPYQPVNDGRCNLGRVWVPPSKNAKGQAVDGYCKDADK